MEEKGNLGNNFLHLVSKKNRLKYLGEKVDDSIFSNLITKEAGLKKSSEIFNSLKKDFLLICECKKASPSKGILVENYHPVEIAKTYERIGAKAISVLTETEYFKGSFADLKEVSQAVPLPVLCKDFVVSEYQVIQAYLKGAKLVLLLIGILEKNEYLKLAQLILELGMVPLVEIFSFAEVETALSFNGDFFLGINNRNLKTLKTDFNHCLEVKKKIEKELDKGNLNLSIIAESGVNSVEQVKALHQNNFAGLLIGESLLGLMQEDKNLEDQSVDKKIKNLLFP